MRDSGISGVVSAVLMVERRPVPSDYAASGNKADQLLMSLVSSEPFRFVEPTKP